MTEDNFKERSREEILDFLEETSNFRHTTKRKSVRTFEKRNHHTRGILPIAGLLREALIVVVISINMCKNIFLQLVYYILTVDIMSCQLVVTLYIINSQDDIRNSAYRFLGSLTRTSLFSTHSLSYPAFLLPILLFLTFIHNQIDLLLYSLNAICVIVDILILFLYCIKAFGRPAPTPLGGFPQANLPYGAVSTPLSVSKPGTDNYNIKNIENLQANLPYGAVSTPLSVPKPGTDNHDLNKELNEHCNYQTLVGGGKFGNEAKRKNKYNKCQWWDEDGMMNTFAVNDYVNILAKTYNPNKCIVVATYLFTFAQNLYIKDMDLFSQLRVTPIASNAYDFTTSIAIEDLTEERRDNAELVIFLVHDSRRMHFILLEYRRVDKVLTVHDSLRVPLAQRKEKYSWIEHTAKAMIHYLWPGESELVRFIINETCKTQNDQVSCGVYVCSYAEMLLNNEHSHPSMKPTMYRHAIQGVLNKGRKDIQTGSTCTTTTNAADTSEPRRSTRIVENSQRNLKRTRECSNDCSKPKKQKNATNRNEAKDTILSCEIKEESESLRKVNVNNKNNKGSSSRKHALADEYPELFDLGEWEPCIHCMALIWQLYESKSICCHGGTIKPSPHFLYTVPECMREIKEYVLSKEGRQASATLRMINMFLGMASCKMRTLKPCDFPKGGPIPVVMKDKLVVELCTLLPYDREKPAFAQLFLENNDKVCNLFEQFCKGRELFHDGGFFKRVRDIVRDNNPFVGSYKMMHEFYQKTEEEYKDRPEEKPIVAMNIVDQTEVPKNLQDTIGIYQHHPGTLNAPNIDNYVAGIYLLKDGKFPNHEELNKGIRIYPTLGNSKKLSIPHISAIRDALIYPVLFPTGIVGYKGHSLEKDNKIAKAGKRKTQSRREFLIFALAQRGATAIERYMHWLFGYRGITQQYLITAFTTIEADSMSAFERYCKEIKSVKCSSVFRYMEQGLKKMQISLGSYVRMPEDYPGSRAWTQKNFYNGMALARKYGRPDLFITFTGNQKWPEIQKYKMPNQTYQDEADLVNRVFYIKALELINIVEKDQFFGEVLASTATIEWQKRGMPHMHYLVILKTKIDTVQKIDNIISAQIPEFPKQPDDPTDKEYLSKMRYYDLVKRFHVHGPCENNPSLLCRQGRKLSGPCQKYYPKDFVEETTINDNGYPEYARPNNGRTIVFDEGLKSQRIATNQHIVPHNKKLLMYFGCHINVECCLFVSSYRYIFKYVNKGADHVIASIRQHFKKNTALPEGVTRKQDGTLEYNYKETDHYLVARQVCASEAVWRIRKFKMHFSSHVARALFAHLENEQNIIFTGDEKDAMNAVKKKKSRFMGYMDLCKKDDKARQMTFVEVDENYRWDDKTYEYKPFKRSGSRVSYLSSGTLPNDIELYALYSLARHEKGYQSYADLRRSVDGQSLHSTFQAAARERGYIVDDEEAEKCMAQAVEIKMAPQLRSTFAILLIFCKVPDPLALWLKYKHELVSKSKKVNYTDEEWEQKALSHIDSILRQHHKSLKSFGLPQVTRKKTVAEMVAVEQMEEAQNELGKTEPLLNDEQREISRRVLEAVRNPQNPDRLFYVQASGGCGKTFLYNYIINYCLANGIQFRAVASTGIAATLLKTGRTAHSAFKIPLHITPQSAVRLDNTKGPGMQYKHLSIIIWDEAFMQHSLALEYVDSTMRLMASGDNREKPFGNVVVLLGGDYKQTLPIVKNAKPEASLECVITKSSLWPLFQTLHLTQNMRVNKQEVQFREWLERVGSGSANETGSRTLKLPQQIMTSSADEIIQFVFPANVLKNPVEMAGRAILCVRNDQALALNERIMKMVEGEEYEFTGITTVTEDDEGMPIDDPTLLETVTPNGMSPHILRLKKGVPVMLLRNLNVDEGLCNGTRLNVKGFTRNGNAYYLLCTNFTSRTNEDVLIPRIDMRHRDNRTGSAFTRRQFPIRLAFAMTINKSQGQTLSKEGLILETPTFSHGQLYVAVSRVTSPETLKVFIAPKKDEKNKKPKDRLAQNIVYDQLSFEVEEH